MPRKVGIVTRAFESTYYGRMLDAAVAELRHLGIESVVNSSQNNASSELYALDSLMEFGCSGVILHSDFLDDTALLNAMERNPTVVLLNRRLSEMDNRCVYNNNMVGGSLAADYLYAKGHRHIAMITGPSDRAESQSRSAGFIQTLAKKSLVLDPKLLIESDFTISGGEQALTQLLQTNVEFTALFCQNDNMAIGAVTACLAARISVPDDISVIGYDDVGESKQVVPPLTTVHQPLRVIGQTAAHLIDRLISKQEAQVRSVENVARNSDTAFDEFSNRVSDKASCISTNGSSLNSSLKSSSREFNHVVYPEITERESVKDLTAKRRSAHTSGFHLTPRETECMYWSAHGKTSWEISQILDISENTVTFHIRNTVKKLGVKNRIEAVAMAVKESLIEF